MTKDPPAVVTTKELEITWNHRTKYGLTGFWRIPFQVVGFLDMMLGDGIFRYNVHEPNNEDPLLPSMDHLRDKTCAHLC